MAAVPLPVGISNQYGNGEVNVPSDNKKWDQEGQRKVAKVVRIKQIHYFWI